MVIHFYDVQDAYTKALSTKNTEDWKLYICLSDLYNSRYYQGV